MKYIINNSNFIKTLRVNNDIYNCMLQVIFGSSYPSEYTRSPIERSESSLYDEWDVLSQIFPARKDYRFVFRPT